jgi:hydrogenase nickel incorporation protein HypB
VDVQRKVLAENDHLAAHVREHFEEHGVLAINVMGSPGSGKTALLEATARALAGRRRVGAVSGDLETDRDGERLRRAGIPATTITTGSACHLDARLVHETLHHFPWHDLDVLFIENVGNLVCPAIYDLGQAKNVVVLSVTEGEDKPLKYPVIFRDADLVVLSKVDLLPHLDVRVDAVRQALARVMPEPRMITVSARTGEGLGAWLDWISRAGARRAAAAPHPPHRTGAPAH